MSENAIQREILEPMQRLFIAPKAMDTVQQTAALKDYSDSLRAFDAADLRAAWESVRDSHTGRGWPPVAVFLLAARNAKKLRVDEKLVRSKHHEENAARWAEWERTRLTEWAQMAVSGGYSWSLRCAILHDGRAVSKELMSQLEMAHRSAEVIAGKIDCSEPVAFKGISLVFVGENQELALKMYQNLQIKEAQTQDEIRRARASHAA